MALWESVKDFPNPCTPAAVSPHRVSQCRGAGVSHYMLDGLGVVSAFYYVCEEDARELVLGMGKCEGVCCARRCERGTEPASSPVGGG